MCSFLDVQPPNNWGECTIRLVKRYSIWPNLRQIWNLASLKAAKLAGK